MRFDDRKKKEQFILQKATRLLDRNQNGDPKAFLAEYFDLPEENVFALKTQIMQGFSDLFYILHPKDFRKTNLYAKLEQIYDDNEDAVVLIQGVKDQIHVVTRRNTLPKNLPLLVSFIVGRHELEMTEIRLLRRND